MPPVEAASATVSCCGSRSYSGDQPSRRSLHLPRTDQSPWRSDREYLCSARIIGYFTGAAKIPFMEEG